MRASTQVPRKRKVKSANDGFETIKVKGMFRVNILENGRIVGDSGWQQNTVVNNGFSNYLVDLLGNSSSSKQISRMMLGTGTGPAAGDNTLDGELNTATYTRTTVTFANSASKTARFTATFASSSSHITAAVTLKNIGIINNSTSGGTMMAASTYATSQWNTNQDINATYDIRFA